MIQASYATALAAAASAAGSQHYPEGALYVVATPIGNLADITLRALHVLQLADVVACEDTRHTQSMLRAYGIDKPAAALLAVHEHNESEAAARVVALLAVGRRVAYASDAGTPAVSDPGARLVAAVRAAGRRVLPLPGASSVTAALSVAGVAAGSAAAQGFVFAGFLPTKAQERDAAVQRLAGDARAVLLLEAPHRIVALAAALATLGARLVTIAREISKQHEEIATIGCDAFAAWLAADANRSRGEFALVLHPSSASSDGDGAAAEGLRVLGLLIDEGLPLKQAVQLAASITGEPRNALYDAGLALKSRAAAET